MELVQTRKMRKARAILRVLAAVEGPRLMVEGFVNGREQGYSVTNYRVQVSFSEDRNSDAIVVQYGRTHHFCMQGNIVRVEGEHSGCMYFSTPMAAAEAIVKYLRENPNPVAVAGTEENDRFVIGPEYLLQPTLKGEHE